MVWIVLEQLEDGTTWDEIVREWPPNKVPKARRSGGPAATTARPLFPGKHVPGGSGCTNSLKKRELHGIN